MAFENKLVIIVNKDIEVGIAMNAIAHVSLSVGETLGKETLSLQDYRDASGNHWPMSEMPYIVLRGKSGEIRKAMLAAKEARIFNRAFTETMTGGSSAEQVERTAVVSQEDHQYYALVLFGTWDVVNQITKKLSLYK